MDAVQTWVVCGKTEGWGGEGMGGNLEGRVLGGGNLTKRESSAASGGSGLHTLTFLEHPTDREAEHRFLIRKRPGTQSPLILFPTCAFLPLTTKREAGAHRVETHVHLKGAEVMLSFG